jgi:hypothetical protein
LQDKQEINGSLGAMKLFDDFDFSEEKKEKSYNGELMEKGKKAEEIVLNWLRNNKNIKEIIDFREWRLTQRLDVDCGIETIDGKIMLAEIKSDKYLGNSNNFLFETFRINHFIHPDSIFYLGWAWRSPAKYLFYYSPKENAVYRFLFSNVRLGIGKYISRCDKNSNPKTSWVYTDKQKTTFNLLIPIKEFDCLFDKYSINSTKTAP